jgi:hypothetical protein
MSAPPRCNRGHAMRVESRFKLDDEPTDTSHITAQLAGLRAGLKARGLELEFGADVTLYYCAVCDFAEARFDYPDKETA